MTCVAIYFQPEAGSRKPEAGSREAYTSTTKCPRVRFNGLAFLVLFFSLLGLSAQLYAATGCTRVADGGWWCWDYEGYTVQLSPDDFNQGYYVAPDGNVGGGGMTSAIADAIKAAAYEIEPHDSNPENRATCNSGLEIKYKYAYYEIGQSRRDTLFTGRRPVPGEAYTITYIGSGETEAWIAGPYVGATAEIPGAPVSGTCG